MVAEAYGLVSRSNQLYHLAKTFFLAGTVLTEPVATTLGPTHDSVSRTLVSRPGEGIGDHGHIELSSIVVLNIVAPLIVDYVPVARYQSIHGRSIAVSKYTMY